MNERRRQSGPVSDARQQRLFGDERGTSAERMPWEVADEEDRVIAQVVFNRPLTTVFEYVVPEELRGAVEPGQRLRVPFGRGNRSVVGYCVGVGNASQTTRALKIVHSVIDARPMLSAKMLDLTRWMADRYLCGWGQVLESVIPAAVKKKAGTRLVTAFRLNADARSGQAEELKLTEKQQAVLDLLASSEQAFPLEQLCRGAGCGPGPVQALRKKGLLEAVQKRVDRFSVDELGPVEREKNLVLNPDQQRALDTVLQAVRTGEHATFVLHGVTGSGKTEVYIQAIQEVVSYGRQAIVLVPEISLTPQTIRRFRSRFDSVAVLHSHLSDVERNWHWQQIAQGRVEVVVGARSAVFAPVPHLGLIVIDEEHETTFKQETVPRYHAREVARTRAQTDRVPLILGSATPTLESWLRAKRGKDVLLSLPQRVADRPLPPVGLVDIRNDPVYTRGAAIGRALNVAIRQALDNKGQVILFLNLRGYSPAVWCRSCGQSMQCPHCAITLTWHRDRNAIVCHFCEFQAKPPAQCPQCSSPGLRYLGTGTQKLEEEVKAKFPGHRCLRMDTDSMRRHGSHDAALEAFRRGEVEILLGTQMIAKGLDFPNVTLVGVVDADTMLHQPDLRASERTFQLIAQVAGRTGRSDRGGRVLVQTAAPVEPAIQMAVQHDYVGFAEWELRNRQEMNAPPFHHLARVILRGPVEHDVAAAAQEMADTLRAAAERLSVPVQFMGPAQAPILRQKGNFRYHFLMRAADPAEIQRLWRGAFDVLPQFGTVEYVIDVDPINMR